MSLLLNPVRWALGKALAAVFEPDAASASSERVTVESVFAPDQTDGTAAAAAPLPTAGVFRPQYIAPLRRPRNDAEAQRLYNHARTVAFWLDSIPFLGRSLPFNVGVDSIIGLIPGYGDFIGLFISLYLVFLLFLFGVPISLLAWCVLNVTIDAFIGIVPILGDALDVAFKANLRNLKMFEDHMVAQRGVTSVGTFSLTFPPSDRFMPRDAPHETSSAARSHSASTRPPSASAGPSARTRSRFPRGAASRPDEPAYLSAEPAWISRIKRKQALRDLVAASTALPSTLDMRVGDRLGDFSEEVPRIAPLALPSSLGAAQSAAGARRASLSLDSENPMQRAFEDEDDGEEEEGGSGSESDEASDAAAGESGLANISIATTATGGFGIPPSVVDASWVISHDASSPLRRSRSISRDRHDFLTPHKRGLRNAVTLPAPGRRDRRSQTLSVLEADSAAEPLLAADGQSQGSAGDLKKGRAKAPRRSGSFDEHGTFGSHQAVASGAKRRKKSFYLVYASIFCVCFFTSLEANTAYLYFNFATSEFGALASFSTVAISQQMVFAVLKPPIAKVSDIFGRAEAYALSVLLYAAGYGIVATSVGITTFILGVVVQSAGSTGLQVLQAIIIADTTSPQYRGLVLGISNIPYLVNFALAGPLVDIVMRRGGWRLGFWIWTVVIPVAALPLLITLSIGQRRARRSRSLHFQQRRSAISKFTRLRKELDVLGLTLLAIGWLLVLLPLTLRDKFTSQTALSFGASGVLVLAAFLYWETQAETPIIPFRVLSHWPVICVCLIGLLDFASFTLTWTYLSSFIQVLRSWEQTRTAYFAMSQNITSTLLGIVAGYIMSATRRYKTLMVFGVVLRLVGVSMMIRYRNQFDPTFMLVLCQLLQGVGGGAVAITMQVACQICVRHADVALVTAFELLTTEIGAAMGSAGAGLIFSGYLPGRLQKNLPMLSQEEVGRIYGSLQVALDYPLGSEIRDGIVASWVEVMRDVSIVATITLAPALLLALLMPNAVLPDSTEASVGNTPTRRVSAPMNRRISMSESAADADERTGRTL